MTYALLNKLTAKPGQRDGVVDILIESGKIFDDNPECHMYLVSESADDPNVIWVVDLWTTREAHAEALRTPELRPYVQKSLPMLEGMPEQIEVRPIGGKDIPD
jgi:quinol monooxygenase YgiN